MVALMGTMVFSVNATAGSVLCSTLGPNNEYDSSGGFFVDGSNGNNQVIANPFTLGTGATVADAVLALGNLYSSGAPNNNPVSVYIESNNGGLPGSIIAQLSQVGTIPPWYYSGKGGGLVTFTCSGAACNLGAGSYWLVAWEPDSKTEQVWLFSYQDQSALIAFNHLGSPTGPWIGPLLQTENAFRIDGAVPEPSILLMLIPGLFGVGYGLRRKLLG